MSAVKRLLTPDTIVLADGMNYIKGYRYQMYCESKAVRTPNCVVSCCCNCTFALLLFIWPPGLLSLLLRVSM